MKKHIISSLILSGSLFAMTIDNPGLYIPDNTKIKVLKKVCDDGYLGFSIFMSNSKTEQYESYDSCDDEEMQGKYIVDAQIDTELNSPDSLIHNGIEYLNREYDGVSLTYDQAVAFCAAQDARLPTLEEVQATNSAEHDALALIHLGDSETVSNNFWTSTESSLDNQMSVYSFQGSIFNDSATSNKIGLRNNVKCVKDIT